MYKCSSPWQSVIQEGRRILLFLWIIRANVFFLYIKHEKIGFNIWDFCSFFYFSFLNSVYLMCLYLVIYCIECKFFLDEEWFLWWFGICVYYMFVCLHYLLLNLSFYLWLCLSFGFWIIGSMVGRLRLPNAKENKHVYVLMHICNFTKWSVFILFCYLCS